MRIMKRVEYLKLSAHLFVLQLEKWLDILFDIPFRSGKCSCTSICFTTLENARTFCLAFRLNLGNKAAHLFVLQLE